MGPSAGGVFWEDVSEPQESPGLGEGPEERGDEEGGVRGRDELEQLEEEVADEGLVEGRAGVLNGGEDRQGEVERDEAQQDVEHLALEGEQHEGVQGGGEGQQLGEHGEDAGAERGVEPEDLAEDQQDLGEVLLVEAARVKAT